MSHTEPLDIPLLIRAEGDCLKEALEPQQPINGGVWVSLIDGYLHDSVIGDDKASGDVSPQHVAHFRERMIRIAALAVAAIEGACPTEEEEENLPCWACGGSRQVVDGDNDYACPECTPDPID